MNWQKSQYVHTGNKTAQWVMPFPKITIYIWKKKAHILWISQKSLSAHWKINGSMNCELLENHYLHTLWCGQEILQFDTEYNYDCMTDWHSSTLQFWKWLPTKMGSTPPRKSTGINPLKGLLLPAIWRSTELRCWAFQCPSGGCLIKSPSVVKQLAILLKTQRRVGLIWWSLLRK